MPARRILSIWFPRLAAERLMRMDPGLAEQPFAVVEDRQNQQMLMSLSAAASMEGLRPAQPLRDAQAMCPRLLTRLANRPADAAFLTALRRWAGKFSPWVAEEAPEGLILDISGCAHLFGGEEKLIAQVEEDCRDLGLSVRLGIAGTVGAAWGLARYAGETPEAVRSGDAIDQEAPATRARAAKRRHWERGGPAPRRAGAERPVCRIAPEGRMHTVLAPLPMAALRVDDETVASLARLGLRKVGDLLGMPRAALARRFGQPLVAQLDRALGSAPEPVSPARPAAVFAVRLTLPDPIGLDEDVMAAVDRLLPELEKRLKAKGRAARRILLQFFRSDSTMQTIELGLARASADPDRIRPLIVLKLGDVDAGFGIDCVRLEAVLTEVLQVRQFRGQLQATEDAMARMASDTRMDDLIGRLGSRIGMEGITRMHPADSHIPEKTAHKVAAAWSEAAKDWPHPPTPRPLMMWPPEPVTTEASGGARARLGGTIRWRRRDLSVLSARGPERIAPEWWLDDPAWRSGVRDYWDVVVSSGERLWIYYAHGGAMSGGWFCQGRFA
ncbi:DNA polymerase Y family protein [Pseudoruegeria sp. HB172150]|uniref:Y-family DNA polymerase n=1 Tax=Pseudoruegeria sp. HB172150 TaxID=2721164 RepID=UPI0015555920|nr:DNA polymerase Y family protein [Pseudoruegeria sp. HB172150]